jgi:hypothetical protein
MVADVVKQTREGAMRGEVCASETRERLFRRRRKQLLGNVEIDCDESSGSKARRRPSAEKT